MIWLSWRRHRSVLIAILLCAIVGALLMIFVGIHVHRLYSRMPSLHCMSPVDLQLPNATCGRLQVELDGGWPTEIGFALPLLFAFVFPGVVGAILGVQMTGRDYANSTNRLAWTQSVTARRSLASEAGFLAIAVIVIMTLVEVPMNAAAYMIGVRYFDGGYNYPARLIVPFDVQGFVVVAFGVFALAAGISAGLFIRRTGWAFAGAFGFYALSRKLLYPLRSHYLAPSTGTGTTFSVPPGSWFLRSGVAPRWSLSPANTLSKGLRQLVGVCQADASRAASALSRQEQVAVISHHFKHAFALEQAVSARFNDALARCYNAHGIHAVTLYQPVSHFWPFQWIETAEYVAIGAAFFASALWYVNRWRI